MAARSQLFYTIYKLGQWGILKGLIYTPFPIVDPHPVGGFTSVEYGLDFGFTNPTALVRGKWHDDGNCYVNEMFYRSQFTNADFIRWLKASDVSKSDYIYADSEAPDRIEEIARAGYNIHPCHKGKDSVINGIGIVIKTDVVSSIENVNLNAEVNSYKWATDKDGRPLDNPEKNNDHIMDGLRYMIAGHTRRLALRVAPQIW